MILCFDFLLVWMNHILIFVTDQGLLRHCFTHSVPNIGRSLLILHNVLVALSIGDLK